MGKHLAIMHRPVLEAILSGSKTIESRFSKHRISPFGQINTGDLVYMKASGGDVIGQFRVKKVYSFEGLNKEDVGQIFSQFGKQINSGDLKIDKDYQKTKADSRFATLIFITQAERFITSPIRFKKSDQRGWVVLQ